MSSSYISTVIVPISLTSFLDFILESHTSPSTLVICSTREDFLQMLLSIYRPSERDISSISEHSDGSIIETTLLVPTIHLLAMSRTINLAFTPTLTNLRAYLAVYEPRVRPTGLGVTCDESCKRTPMLGILNVLQLHRGTGDFSAQGMSRTLAAAVDAAARSDMQLFLGELPVCDDENGDRDAQIHPSEGDLWSEQVPLLCGSLRFGEDQRIWAGRTVEIRQVAARWCKFRTLDQVKEMD